MLAVTTLAQPYRFSAAIHGCLETLEQGRDFLNTIGDDHYTYVAKPHVSSSIGQHFRHWLDIFHALRSAPNTVDYNQRRRGHPVESSREVALSEIDGLIAWLESEQNMTPTLDIDVVMEVSLSQTESCTFHSTLERELAFAALHANHHFAMAKVVTSLLNVQTPSDFGLAPATATFLRGNA
ncbi:TPA: hypothetical protein KD875_002650 [Vibrio cholerae]|nr:hypothetical protein [Vibrio cholerae]